MNIIINDQLETIAVLSSVNGIRNTAIAVDGGMIVSGDMNGEMPGMETEASGNGSLLSSWGFVGGITAATLVVSIVLGILLAKKRIKKGFDLYED